MCSRLPKRCFAAGPLGLARASVEAIGASPAAFAPLRTCRRAPSIRLFRCSGDHPARPTRVASRPLRTRRPLEIRVHVTRPPAGTYVRHAVVARDHERPAPCRLSLEPGHQHRGHDRAPSGTPGECTDLRVCSVVRLGDSHRRPHGMTPLGERTRIVCHGSLTGSRKHARGSRGKGCRQHGRDRHSGNVLPSRGRFDRSHRTQPGCRRRRDTHVGSRSFSMYERATRTRCCSTVLPLSNRAIDLDRFSHS